jgi:hypothetical protein
MGGEGGFAGNAVQSSGTVINQTLSVTTPKALSEKELTREFRNLSRQLAMDY